MVASRIGPKGAVAPFGLAPLAFVLMTTSIGYQGLAALVAKQPQVAAPVHQSLAPAFAASSFAASPFATIRAATISLPQPLGTAMPQPPRLILASYDPGERDVTGIDQRRRAAQHRARHRGRAAHLSDGRSQPEG